jgi:hypothetical protein
MKSITNGKKYELIVHNICKQCYIDGIKFNIQDENELGASTTKNDIKFNYKDSICSNGIEVKNTLRSEFIQLDIHQENGLWVGPKKTKRSHPDIVVNNYINEVNDIESLFYGKPPVFPFNTRKEFDIWEKKFITIKKLNNPNKKKINKEYTWNINNNNFIKNNYREKENKYIQIKNYGLYHLGNDICNFNVPEFIPSETRLRLRCKRRGGIGCVPSSLTISAWCNGLTHSPYSLDNINKLPPNLIYKSNQ